MVKALSPKDVNDALAQGVNLPDGVIEAVNELLIKNGSSKYITLRQCDVVHAISERMGVTKDTIYNNKWLDFEDFYRAAGWKVSYDKPAYNETYEPTFEFIKP